MYLHVIFGRRHERLPYIVHVTGRVTCALAYMACSAAFDARIIQLMRHSDIRTLFSDQRWADEIVLVG